ncbi:MAG: hypothetical protein IPL46_22355 [Saprospiraceae bacterium]|nr:hypothetical protein [Saprospiraceae bacterium]
MRKTIISYSLHCIESTGCYLPAAYFVEERPEGTLGYMIAKAVPENVDSYKIPIAGTPHEQLLQICYQLSAAALEEKYNAKSRKKISLEQIFNDPKTGTLINQYVQRKMQQFLTLVQSSEVPLCLDIQRQVFLEQIRIRFSIDTLRPNLSFIKMKEGIEYRLELRAEEHLIIPHNHDVHIILDEPGYLLIDYKLYELQFINGNKIKPFIKKKEVFIPQRITKTYFEKFIMDVVNKVDIDAEGFEVEQLTEILRVSTYFTEDFIENRYILDLVFHYEEAFFYASDPTARRNRLIMDNDGNVTIRQIIRSEKENEFLKQLKIAGLERNAARRYVLEGQKGKFDIIQWVINHRHFFEANHIELVAPKIEGNTVRLEKAEIYLNTVVDNDWFDIKGSIKIGEFTFYFADLMESIRQDNPLFILPNGEVFIIPESWMTKYQALARFGKRSGDDIRINKSQYTLMEDSEDLTEGMGKVVIDDADIEYGEDKNLKAELRPYQLEGVRWLLKHQANGLGACLADDMGLGKTLQTLAVLSSTKDQLKGKENDRATPNQLTLFQQHRFDELTPLRALVLLPASLVFNWIEEIQKFCPHFSICAYIGVERSDKRVNLDQFDIILTTYQTALRDIRILQKTTWEYIILDESHVIKNRESKIFQAVNTLKTENKISLSGTPIENSLADLWSQMQFINPGLLGSFSFFKEHFLTPI